MTRRPASPQPVDHSRDRARWAELIRDVHAVAAGEGRMLSRELGDKANTARNYWAPVAGYPGGVVCGLFATAAWAWARSEDGARRDQVKGIMLSTAGMVDELLDETANVAPPAAPEQQPAAVGRLPYRED